MNSQKSLAVLAGGALLACGLSVLAFAPSGGRVTIAVGAAGILRNHQVLPVQKGTPVQAGDELSTPSDGKLQWWMDDDSMVAIASASRVQIHSFAPQSKAVYSLQEGGVRIVSGAASPTVLTPLATVEALGTDFSVILCDSGCKRDPKGKRDENLYVRIDQGRVRVHNGVGNVVADAGQVVFVASPKTKPKIVLDASAILADVRIELEFEVGLGDFVPEVPIQPLPPVELPGSPS